MSLRGALLLALGLAPVAGPCRPRGGRSDSHASGRVDPRTGHRPSGPSTGGRGRPADADDRLSDGWFDVALKGSYIRETERVSDAFDPVRRALGARVAELLGMSRATL